MFVYQGTIKAKGGSVEGALFYFLIDCVLLIYQIIMDETKSVSVRFLR